MVLTLHTRGDLVSEVLIKFDRGGKSMLAQRVRLVNAPPEYPEISGHVHLTHTLSVEPDRELIHTYDFLPLKKTKNRQRKANTLFPHPLLSQNCRLTTSMKSGSLFYTDNGLEMQARQRDKGSTTRSHIDVHGKAEALYYPCISTAVLRDSSADSQFTVCPPSLSPSSPLS